MLRGGQADLVPGVHDHVPVVDSLEQLANIPEAGVKALEVAPALADSRKHVARALGSARVLLIGDRVSTELQIRGLDRDPLRGDRHIRPTHRPAKPIPEDLEIGAQSQTSRTGARKQAIEIDQDRLVLARGEAQASAHNFKLSACVGDLQREALRRRVASLPERHIN